jgi:SET domain/MYND finger
MQSNLRKSDSESVKFRNEGNQLYKKRNFIEALLKYNMSLCHADIDSNLAFAFSNRSAVYFELKLYQQCLNNIQLARKHNYPAVKILEDREKRCLELMMEETKICDNPFDFFKLSYAANPKIPFIIDGVEMKVDKKYGRGIYTKHVLKVGDIISIETPFFSSFEPESDVEYFNFCHFCLKDNLLDLIPCLGCNTTMYCDESCAKSDSSCHQTVCKSMTPFKTKFNACSIISRSYIKTAAITSESTQAFRQLLIESLQFPTSTIFDFDFSNPNDPEYQKNLLKTSLCLDKNTKLNLPSQSPIAEYLYQIIDRTACAVNTNGFTSKKVTAVCLFGALVNHSSAPNVSRIDVEDKVCFMLLRPIAAGEQLFDCYTQPFFSLPTHIRQERLIKYGFKCDCEACSYPKKFSEFEQLKISKRKLHQYAQDKYMKTNFEEEKRSELLKNVAELKMKVTEAATNFPSQEYFMLRSLLKDCVETLALRYR